MASVRPSEFPRRATASFTPSQFRSEKISSSGCKKEARGNYKHGSSPVRDWKSLPDPSSFPLNGVLVLLGPDV